jgi:hypothetical protein
MNNQNKDDLISAMLKFDPLDKAEQITGKSYKESKATEALGFLFMQNHSAAKHNLLSRRGDTTFTMDFDSYVKLVESQGFEKIHEHHFSDDRQKDEIYQVWFHEIGLILACDSFGSARNLASVYYNWKPNEFSSSHSILHSGSWYVPNKSRAEFLSMNQKDWQEQAIWVGHFDAREALLFELNRLMKNGQFLSPWVQRPFLWFVDYSQTRGKEYDCNKITNDVIKTFPKKVKKLLGKRLVGKG